MNQDRNPEGTQASVMLDRRKAITGAVASGIAVTTHSAFGAQSTPAVAGAIVEERLMALSGNLCGGANLKSKNAGTLLSILNSDNDIMPALEELEAVGEFTEEVMAELSPEAQDLAVNILQYWFLGRYEGEPVEGRSEMFFDLACWQTLPYATQPSTCKSFGYWAAEIEL